MAPVPSIGRIVTYRSRTGGYDVPAIITATVDTLADAGVMRWHESEGQAGVPPLSSPDHVHLTVFTPGLPGYRADADGAENVGGTYQEWDIPLFEAYTIPDPRPGAQPQPEPVEPGSWRWPERV